MWELNFVVFCCFFDGFDLFIRYDDWEIIWMSEDFEVGLGEFLVVVLIGFGDGLLGVLMIWVSY